MILDAQESNASNWQVKNLSPNDKKKFDGIQEIEND